MKNERVINYFEEMIYDFCCGNDNEYDEGTLMSFLYEGDEKELKKNFVLKYAMKSFPIGAQIGAYLPMFYPDVAKDLGIKAQSQSGFGR